MSYGTYGRASRRVLLPPSNLTSSSASAITLVFRRLPRGELPESPVVPPRGGDEDLGGSRLDARWLFVLIGQLAEGFFQHFECSRRYLGCPCGP